MDAPQRDRKVHHSLFLERIPRGCPLRFPLWLQPSVAGGGLLPEVGSCLTLEMTCPSRSHADKARDVTGKGRLGGELAGQGTPKNCSALGVLGFMVMGLVWGLSQANHSDTGVFLVACAPLSQDGLHPEGFGEVGRTYGLVSLLSF